MRLTVELVEGAAQYIHPATRDRELDLRGYKIPVIENMGSTRDQFDSIDFSDNEIRKLENFPLLKRISKLLLNNNRISRMDVSLCQSLPNLSWLILTNNEIKELGDIDCLSSLSRLQCLSLINNPIVTKKHYRPYVIHKLPSVRILDFRRVRKVEREESGKLFKGKRGKALVQEIGSKSQEFVPGEAPIDGLNASPNKKRVKRTPAEVQALKAAIAKAQTIEEVERLQIQLSGEQPLVLTESGDGGDAPAGDQAMEQD